MQRLGPDAKPRLQNTMTVFVHLVDWVGSDRQGRLSRSLHARAAAAASILLLVRRGSRTIPGMPVECVQEKAEKLVVVNLDVINRMEPQNGIISPVLF
jgi:hypothetical protein